MQYKVHRAIVFNKTLPKTVAWKFRQMTDNEKGLNLTIGSLEGEIGSIFSERQQEQLSTHSVINWTIYF